MAELAQNPAERNDLERTDLLRWEDDGGQPSEHKHPADHSTLAVTLGNNQPMTLPLKEEIERQQRHWD